MKVSVAAAAAAVVEAPADASSPLIVDVVVVYLLRLSNLDDSLRSLEANGSVHNESRTLYLVYVIAKRGGCRNSNQAQCFSISTYTIPRAVV